MNRAPADILKAVVIVGAIVSAVISLGGDFTGGPQADFTLPILIESAIVIVAIEVNSIRRRDLRIDGMTIFLCFELLRGCVMPVLTQLVGQAPPQYFHLGTWADARSVLLLGNVFAASVLVGQTVVVFVSRTPRRARAFQRKSRGGPFLATPVPLGVLIGIGLIGLLLRFPSLAAVQGFVAGDYDALSGAGFAESGALGLVSSLVRPLLSIGLGILFVRRIKARKPSVLIALLLLTSVVFGLGSYGLNRGTFIYAIFAFCLVLFEGSSRRLRPWALAIGVSAGGIAFVGFGILRRSLTAAQTGLDPMAGGIAYQAVQSVIPYFAPPLELAVVLPASASKNPWGVDTLVASILSTIPKAPESLRDHTGTTVLNEVIYQRHAAVDQLFPSWLEMYLSLGVVGLVLAGMLLVVFIAGVDALRLRARNTVSSYAATLAMIWIAQASWASIISVEQNLIFFALVPAVAGLVPQRRSEFSSNDAQNLPFARSALGPGSKLN